MIAGLKYLKENRHLTDETIQTFQLGYCDANSTIYEWSNFSQTGLTLSDPRFKNTALFPIFDLYGDLIAVSGRALSADVQPKYINTVYPKTNHLFGLNITWPECLKTKTVYVVEGNVDTMMMYQAGIKNVVGMLGSNLTAKQLCLLSRFAEKIVLVPDGDNAGEKFLEKIKAVIPKKYNNFDVKFSMIQLPKGYDPDKFLFENGKDALLNLEHELFPTLLQRLNRRT
jgi:DNA primase